ncbi:lactadherin-like [Dendronephthya gigantea]|uniref:lactadherin-like n=1 Tax=Dendronephthya gigantea TaxID=151771 RepID=UPI00106C3C8F|nr:lactadherin-like [Dendronephthya gigantea]
MSTSNDDVDYPDYKEFGQIKANYDERSVVEQRLTRTVVARFVRLNTKALHKTSSMRIEFQGEYIVTNWFDPVPLGMQSRMIVDSQITASSSKFFQSGAWNGRLNLTTVDNVRYGGWIAADYDSDPWLEVDFIANITLTSISTQGLDGGQSWVRSYTVAFGFRRVTLEEYKHKDEIKVFNASSGLTVKQDLYPFIIARYIQIKPKMCTGSCSLRVEFYGRYEDPPSSVHLGMQSSAILDSQLTASSFEFWDRTAAKARLNAAKAWVRHGTDTKPWVKVDFLGRIKLTGILTQGRGAYDCWVTSFTMSTSNDDVDYPAYKEFGQIKLFQANYDQTSVVEQRLTRTVVARFVRLNTKAWHKTSSMRIEFQGEYIVTNWFDPVPMGMQSRMIVDSQITASSSKFFQSGAWNGRLNLTTVDNVRYGGWIAADYDSDPWLEVDFIANITLTSISTQGLDGGQSWVQSYTVASGFHRDALEEYKHKDEIKMFNASSGLTVKQDLYPFIIARYIQIKPKICTGSCSLRVEFYGRYEDTAILFAFFNISKPNFPIF